MDHKHPVMLVGSAGCGKSVLMNEKLTSLQDNYAVANIPFNYYTTSGNLSTFDSMFTSSLYISYSIHFKIYFGFFMLKNL